jgi:adenylyl-sulfate kinase
MKNAPVIWFTGVSGAGKTTLSRMLRDKLSEQFSSVVILDGDEVRAFFERDLGMSREHREINVRRIAFTAEMLSRVGTTVIVANIAPYFNVRDFIRRKVDNYFQVYVRTTLDTVRERDVKGLYRKFDNGEITNMIGLDDPYQEPRNPDVVVDSSCESAEESLRRILETLDQKEVVQF